jgi:hypothetical protein
VRSTDIVTEGSPMKPLRTIVVFSAGIAAGLAIARKMTEDDPDVLHGPTRATSQSPARRLASAQAQRITNRAQVASLDAIRRARGRIRERLGEDDVAWN